MGGWNKMTHKDTAAFSSAKQTKLEKGQQVEVEGSLCTSRSSCLEESHCFPAVC